MLPQNSRIRRLRVALRAAEWFFISVHVFDVVFISAGFMDLESKSDKSKSEFFIKCHCYILLVSIEIVSDIKNFLPEDRVGVVRMSETLWDVENLLRLGWTSSAASRPR